jgi:Ras-related protein Rab-11A
MIDIPKDIKYEVLPEDYTQYDLSFKVIVIGDAGVGKSSLTNKATKNIFNDEYAATVGFEFFTFNMKISDKIVKLQIWDTCGQEIYRSLITNFYRNSSLAIIVYAINNKDSFNNVDMWLKEIRTHSSPDVKVILIGNKIDLESERQISTEEGQSFANRNKLSKFVEASAKTGINTQTTFINVAYLLFSDYMKYKNNDEDNVKAKEEDKKETNKTQKINTNNTKKKSKSKSKGGCC